jgi:hypothetical protein
MSSAERTRRMNPGFLSAGCCSSSSAGEPGADSLLRFAGVVDVVVMGAGPSDAVDPARRRGGAAPGGSIGTLRTRGGGCADAGRMWPACGGAEWMTGRDSVEPAAKPIRPAARGRGEPDSSEDDARDGERDDAADHEDGYGERCVSDGDARSARRSAAASPATACVGMSEDDAMLAPWKSMPEMSGLAYSSADDGVRGSVGVIMRGGMGIVVAIAVWVWMREERRV